MEDTRMRPICLTGKDALEFSRALYCPTTEELSQRKEHEQNIFSAMHVRPIENGEAVFFEGLDLSFLDSRKENVLEVNICISSDKCRISDRYINILTDRASEVASVPRSNQGFNEFMPDIDGPLAA